MCFVCLSVISLELGVSLEATSLSLGMEVKFAYIPPSPDPRPYNSFAICGILVGMVVVVGFVGFMVGGPN
ncbi:hypothetical protein Hanom_Chr06g00513011 [Helianthus anomalus]